MSLQQTLQNILTNPTFLATWIAFVVASEAVLVWDLWTNNNEMKSLMKLVWVLTVLYSGPLGLAIYWYSGRQQIAHDSFWRKGFRSVAHCYSGCGAGEVTGIVLTVGILALANFYVIAITFGFAYLFGYALTVGPLVQEGETWRQAIKDALYSETASITVMEIVAISVDIWLAGEATMGDVLFWSSLFFSLSLGLIAAYPVNLVLIYYSVKEGMMNPKKMATDMGM
ncbi:DUF4396 domain-containing protein (plasmid) [Halorussus limi]|uniref:DUF4396 domain-containing protein n=1 Tax=Halorussus limi TaxID=2938695 RepID=A0A8U0I1X4_9EURY|nr:DUF4396 domain-containing protein [Halorussus limi]UPV76694.1 DUF4396 domain-containing protein [Halorussus limi]